MSNTKNKTAQVAKSNKSEKSTASGNKTISPAKERPEEPQVEQVKISSGVSPLGVVFLSLLTTIALITGTFAFRDKIIFYASKYINISPATSQGLNTNLPGFVPIPTLTNTPTISTDSSLIDKITNKQKDMEVSLTKLQEQLAARHEKPAAQQVDAISPELAESINTTEAKLAESLAKISALEAQVGELQNLTTSLANKPEAPAVNVDIRGLVAFQALQSKALSGQPFQASLQRVLALLDDTSPIEGAVTSLEKIAQTGRPSLAILQKSFNEAITSNMQKANDEDTSIIGKVKNNLSSFIRVRRTDGSGSDNEVIIATAEKALQKGDVKTSYVELLKLDNSAKAAFGEWLPQARSYYHLPESLEALQLELANSLEAKE